MALPKSRSEFKTYCLRKLGAPVIEINVDDDQVDDRIDEALQYYMNYHFDGAEKTYYKYEITEQDKINKYITLPENIIGSVSIFDIGKALNSNDIFNIRYQIALNDLYTLTNVSMTPYYMAMSHISFLEEMLVGKQPIRYNRNNNKLYIDMSWDLLHAGQFIIVEAYQVVDPDLYVRTWSDLWLLRYGACLVKEQWGSNITKFSDMKLPGGVKFNGEKIFNDAVTEKLQLEKEMVTSWSLPAGDMIG